MLNSFRASSVTPVVFLKDERKGNEHKPAPAAHWPPNTHSLFMSDNKCVWIQMNSGRSVSVYLACICCSKLCCILIPSWSSWSHCWARPTVLCSVYLLSKIRASSIAAPKSSIFFSWLRMARISWCLRYTHTHTHTHIWKPSHMVSTILELKIQQTRMCSETNCPLRMTCSGELLTEVHLKELMLRNSFQQRLIFTGAVNLLECHNLKIYK